MAVYDYDRFSSSDQTGEFQLPLNQVNRAQCIGGVVPPAKSRVEQS